MAVVKRALEVYVRSSKRENAPKLSRGEWQELAKVINQFAAERRDVLLDAAYAAIFVATARSGDRMRCDIISFGSDEDDYGMLESGDMLEQSGADRRQAPINTFVKVCKDIATESNYNALSSIMHGFLTNILVEGFPEAESSPHPSHGSVCHRTQPDDDTHWSVVLAHCGACRMHSDTLLFCSRCHAAAYCNADCQRAAWKRHKPVCQPS